MERKLLRVPRTHCRLSSSLTLIASKGYKRNTDEEVCTTSYKYSNKEQKIMK